MRDLRPRVAVAGASGFVGRALVEALVGRAEVVALGRHGRHGEWGPDVRFVRFDLFSIEEAATALAGVEVAYYLVHSMLPSARLTQARFEDLDLLLADNFGRAAASAGVQRIIYLGGLMPGDCDTTSLSAHLRSRLEVERALAAHGVEVTAVRAGLVVGAGGSSLEMLVRLVRRLPAMICPRWTRSKTQPIALEDVVEILRHCLDDPETAGRVCEVGGPDVLTYREMMEETARVLGRRRFFLTVPLFTPGLSRLWVSLVTGFPRQLVAPLVQSLRHPMVVTDPWLQERMGLRGRRFSDSLAEAALAEPAPPSPTARSVQRVPRPAGRDAEWVAAEYLRWLPRALGAFLRVEQDGGRSRILARGSRRPLLTLVLRKDPQPGLAVLDVADGSLAAPGPGSPRLEFRTTPDGRRFLVALEDFRPRLPWGLYSVTQAPLHRLVMAAFGRHLARL